MASFSALVSVASAPSVRPSVTSGGPDHRVVKQRRHRHPASEWESRREDIIHLYSEERKTAEEVVERLRLDYGFNTGRRQLYTKLDEWGVKKNKKQQSERNNGARDDVQHSTAEPEVSLDDFMQGVSFTPLTQRLETPSRLSSPDVPSVHWRYAKQTPQPNSLRIDSDRIMNADNVQPHPIPLSVMDFGTPSMLSNSLSTPPWLGIQGPLTIKTHQTAVLEREAATPEHVPCISNQIEIESGLAREMTPIITTVPSGRNPDNISSLERSLNGVLDFISGKECSLRHENSTNLKNNVNKLLQLSQRMAEHSGRPSPTFGDSGSHDLGEGLSLTRSLISTAPNVASNIYKPADLSQEILPSRVAWKRRWKTVRFGDITLTMTEKTSGTFSGENDQDSEALDYDWHVGTKVAFRSKNSTHILQIEVQQYQVPFGAFSMAPRFVVNNIIPNDSQVFKIAKEGSAAQLLHLFATRQASLRDCNKQGASLLYYGASNPSVCKLLVENGLDVDEIFDNESGGKTTPLHIALDNLNASEILLTAGADPTIDLFGQASFIACSIDHSEEQKEIFDLAPHFEISSYRNYWDQSVLHLICMDYCMDYHRGLEDVREDTVGPEILIQLALDRGFQANEINDIGTPLHGFFRSLLPKPLGRKWLEALAQLVQSGLDVYATDKWGTSVSDIAYAETTCHDYSEDLGSYRGDLFDALLIACSYNIADFRRGRHRVARYTRYYRREDFEKLWEGREHLCPYWNDEPCFPLTQQECFGISERREDKVLCICSLAEPTRWMVLYDTNTYCSSMRHWRSSFDDTDSESSLGS
ncbi:hypothetical protein F5Y16DRAFT_372082 [Xylariaceae sp. FL0255]|nr:hypothetical protein F5Y16DRAFT_372082 [Xylariaceae sp. FL0255]